MEFLCILVKDAEFITHAAAVFNDLRQGLNGCSLGGGIVHQNANVLLAVNILFDVGNDLLGGDVVARSIGGINVPVEIEITSVFNLLGKGGHNSLAIFAANGVGRAAGEADDVGGETDLLLNLISQKLKIGKICIGGGVNLAVFVLVGVKADGVAAVISILGNGKVAGADNKEGCLNVISIENVKDFGCVGRRGAVVEGEVNTLNVIIGAVGAGGVFKTVIGGGGDNNSGGQLA